MCKNGCMSLMTMYRIVFYVSKHFAVYQILPHVILATILEWLDWAGINIPILQTETPASNGPKFGWLKSIRNKTRTRTLDLVLEQGLFSQA